MLYKLLSSLKTSVYLLSLMCLIFLIGTIFPQGENIDAYIKAGGKYVSVVRTFDFLDIFMSPLFLTVTCIMLLNLAVCLYDRFKIFRRIKRKPFDFERLKNHSMVQTFKKNDLEEKLRATGFKLKAETKDAVQPGVRVFEKGLQYWWLSWFYHVGIILAILGFFLTSLFAFEKYVVLYPDTPQMISLYSDETRWNRFLRYIGQEPSEDKKTDEYTLTLKEFRTEYYQGLKIDYPKDKIKRLALGLGLDKIEPSKKGFSYMPKMWLTRLDVQRPDNSILDAELWVNRPFRTGPLTLYQMGYEQKLRIRAAEKIIDVEARVPFQVKDVKGKFVVGSLKAGWLFKKDGTEEKITPHTTLYYIPDEDPAKRDEIGKIELGEIINAKGITFEFRRYEEGSYLSYRKDPGVWLVGIACLFVFLGLFVRSLGAWYRVQFAREGNTGYVLISTRGILADKDRMQKKLNNY